MISPSCALTGFSSSSFFAPPAMAMTVSLSHTAAMPSVVFLAYLRGEVAKLPNRGIFLEDQFSVLIREYLQRVTVTDHIDMVDLVRVLFRALDYGDG